MTTATAGATPVKPDRLLCLIATYNTNLQGNLGLPQDLVDWLSPTFTVSSFLAGKQRAAPDVVAVGFQELLPLNLGLAGLSRSVMNSRAALIQSQIEKNAPGKEKYNLVAQAVNVGVALLVFARDDGVANRICDVQTQWTGCGPAYLGNKGAVGVRFRAKGTGGDEGEIYTFVCAHLTAHAPKLQRRVQDYKHIASTLLFPSLSTGPPTTMYYTSHLFFFGDLNFRVAIPSLPAASSSPTSPLKITSNSDVINAMSSDTTREQLIKYDQLISERQKGTVAQLLREGEFWRFKCTYKFQLGQVDRYSTKRTPSWTDRILYTSYQDSPDTREKSAIENLVYTSVPSYTTSDHKPVVALLLLPSPRPSQTTPPLLIHPTEHTPDPNWRIKRWIGKALGWPIGWVWCLISLLGIGHESFGVVNFVLALGAWKWFRGQKQELSLP